MSKGSWFENIRDELSKSDSMNNELLSHIRGQLGEATQLKNKSSEVQKLLLDINEYSAETNKQIIGVNWQDKAYYDLYKLCGQIDYTEGKDFFKSLISTQGFLILAGKEIAGAAGQIGGEWLDVAANQAKSMGGVLKEGVESLLNKVTEKNEDKKSLEDENLGQDKNQAENLDKDKNLDKNLNEDKDSKK